MYPRPAYTNSIFQALRDRELGLSSRKPSQVSILGGFTTTRNDEYGFWNVTHLGVPSTTPPFSLNFSTYLRNGHALLATDEEGVLTLLDTTRTLRSQMFANTRETSPIARFRGHDNAIFDATFMRHDSLAATASGDGTVRVFDLETTFRVAMLEVGKGSVKCVRARPDGSGGDVVAAASRDGLFKVFDVRMPSSYEIGAEAFLRPVAQVAGAHQPKEEDMGAGRRRKKVCAKPPPGVTSLVWRNEMELITGGAADGAVKLWDLRRCSRKADCVQKVVPGLEGRGKRAYGIASMDICNGKLAVSCTDSSMYIYDSSGLQFGHMHLLEGHTQTSFYIRARFSPCGNFILSGSADSNAYLWDLNSESVDGVLTPALRLEGHGGGDVAAVAWCGADIHKVATCGDDTTVKMWTVKGGQDAAEPLNGEENGSKQALNAARKVQGGVRKRSRNGRNAEVRRIMRNADIRSFFTTNSP